jgi:hypothetical protein
VGHVLVNLAAVIAFWKRKDSQSAPEHERIIPLPQLPPPEVDLSRTTSKEQVDRARETLKVLKLEKQIIGSAVATIYESHTKGLISTIERDRLLQKYKIDLGGLDKTIDENQRVVDLYDLEMTREELVKNFKTKLTEIDARIKNLRSGGQPIRNNPNQQNPDSSDASEKASTRTNSGQQSVEKNSKTEQDQQITDAEKRIEEIREEILKAMDRLEQIEAEG